MKGLLIKDLCIIAKNKKIYGIMIFLIAFMFLMQGEGMESFIISYTTILGGSLVLSTISTDEFDKSTMFLMTMPINRKTYALEKYVFSFGCSMIGWSVSTAVCCMITANGAIQLVKVAMVMLLILSLFQLLMIPIQLKFGGENGRIALMGIIIAVFLLGFIIKKASVMIFPSQEAAQVWLQGVLRFFDSMKPVPVAIAMVVGFAICCWISIEISIKIMEKREF